MVKRSSVLESKVFNLFVNDFEKALYSEAAECAALLFSTIKIKTGCKGTAKLLNVCVFKGQTQDRKG